MFNHEDFLFSLFKFFLGSGEGRMGTLLPLDTGIEGSNSAARRDLGYSA